MEQKLLVLAYLTGCSSLGGAALYALARRGRNLKRFSERQRLYTDLHRFSVTIVTAFALYLLGTRVPLWQLLPFPDAIPLFATTVIPALLLCLLSARWYLGFPAALLVQWFVLTHSNLSHHFLQNALLSLAGLALYLLYRAIVRSETKRTEEQKALLRFLTLKKQAFK
jgi:hypothetical protein